MPGWPGAGGPLPKGTPRCVEPVVGWDLYPAAGFPDLPLTVLATPLGNDMGALTLSLPGTDPCTCQRAL